MLLDVHLPDMSGLDVLAALRAEGSDVGVVMVTAERGADAVRTALHGGAMQYLVKPFEYDDLAAPARAGWPRRSARWPPGRPTRRRSTPCSVARRRPAAASAPLPKGLSPETADLVLAALRASG